MIDNDTSFDLMDKFKDPTPVVIYLGDDDDVFDALPVLALMGAFE